MTDITDSAHAQLVRHGNSGERRHGHGHEKIMRLTLNHAFVHDVHEQGVRDYVAALVEVARHHDLSVTQFVDALDEQWDARGLRVSAVSTERLAEQFADPERFGLVVEDDEGHRLSGEDWALTDSPDDEGYSEPGSPGRPFYS